MTDKTCQPFKPDTWPVDADGFAADLCTECGTPVRYGSRHTDCGRKAMGLPTVADARAALKPAVYAGPAPDLLDLLARCADRLEVFDTHAQALAAEARAAIAKLSA